MAYNNQRIKVTLQTLPKKPGVYIFRDKKNEMLYVGKAKNLKNRVASYFQKQSALEERKKIMVAEITDLETIITPTEADALLLEAALIKKEWPPYNVVMKDDKFFLYIRVTLSEKFPTVDLVRKITNKKDIYFGPYTSSASARETLKALKLIFKFRTCTPNQGKPCFDYTIGRCLGVCIGEISEKEYRAVINQLLLFLRGKGDAVINGLRKTMGTLSKQKKFERAARIRDRITALEKIIKQQTVVSNRKEDSDILGIARDGRRSAVAVLQIRSGKLIHKQTIQLTSAIKQSESDIIKAFIEQYYTEIPEHPSIVYTEILPDDISLLKQTLHITISRPQRGAKATLAYSAHENAAQALASYLASFEKDERATLQSLNNIKTVFSLARVPNRIESFDVANISGKHAVGAMIVFVNGKPTKELYKKFTIRTLQTPDDPRMLAEVVKRRIERMKLLSAGWEKPDLIILDGGKGQLSITKKILGPDAHLVPLVALAKGGHAQPTKQSHRETFFLNDGRALQLSSTSRELFLLERIRDEAHRFATTFYRKKHLKSQSMSALDEIPGIGEKRKKDLLRHFGSVERIKKARVEQISKIIGKSAAASIHRYL
ncbi:MAG: excinuclease ABC subunit UvrC [Patescibacteria group bacterium]